MCVSRAVQGPVHQLQDLLRAPRQSAHGHILDNAAQQRKVTRAYSGGQGGIAFKFGQLVEEQMRLINKVHGLDKYPLTLADAMHHFKAGRDLMAKLKNTGPKAAPRWKEAVSALTGSVSRGVKEAVIGVLGRSTSQGQLSTPELMLATGQSKRYVNKAKKAAVDGKVSALTALVKSGGRAFQELCPSRATLEGICKEGDLCKLVHECQCCRADRTGTHIACRKDHAAADCPAWSLAKCLKNNGTRRAAATRVTKNCLSMSEKTATQGWFSDENPARSGDQKAICWMTKGFKDFYEDDYRSVEAQMDIIKRAMDVYGADLEEAAGTRKNVWLRNVDKYLVAERTGTLFKLRVKDLRPSANYLDVIEQALNTEHDTFDYQDPAAEPSEGKHDCDKDETTLPDQDDDDTCPHVLTPRSESFFYKRALGGLRLWKRPPHNHCDRCGQHATASDTVKRLTVALLSDDDDPEHANHLAMVDRAGGRTAGWATVRKLTDKMPSLRKHMEWQASQRPYTMMRDKNLTWKEVMMYLDYGGFTDSANKKVSVWSATALAKDRPQEHFDFFFDQGAKGKDKEGTAKKNGQTGISFLAELFDPAKSPWGDGVSMFHHYYPGKDEVNLSGDTGNGYRAYEMLEELSKFFSKYGIKVKLMPLPPGHAWNRTDARIAHQNTFLEALKAVSRVYGAEEIASAFHAASDEKYIGTRKYMERSHCYYRTVQHDAPKQAATRKKLGEQLYSAKVDKGHIGVRGLLYFNFSVVGPKGDIIYPHGYARVREFADPNRPDNPTHVWTWRKDLAANMCQACSDAWGGPVDISVNGCTKKMCAVVKKTKQADDAAAAARVLPQQPVSRDQHAGAADGASQPAKSGEDVDPAPAAKPAKVADGSARKRGRPKLSQGGAPPPKRPQPDTAAESKTRVMRQVRVVHGVTNGRAQVWMYVPHEPKSDTSKTVRRGFWLDKAGQENGHFMLRPAAAIQEKGGPRIEDVVVFKAFPFWRLVKLSAKKKELPKTIRFLTCRPFSAEEITAAKNDEDVAGPLEDIAEGHIDNDQGSMSGASEHTDDDDDDSDDENASAADASDDEEEEDDGGDDDEGDDDDDESKSDSDSYNHSKRAKAAKKKGADAAAPRRRSARNAAT
jgi:hypothetical protein